MRENSGRLARLLVPLIATGVLGSCSSWERSSAPEIDDGGEGPSPPASGNGEAGATPIEDASTADGAPDAAAAPSYTNPVFPADFPDPFVLRDGSRYLAFSTNAAGKNVRVVTSTDLGTWTELPDALPVLPVWAKANASLTWAPSVLERGSTFVLYYTARSVAAGFQCIGRAISTTAAGPYVDPSDQPFICQADGAESLCGSIDPSPFVDENGDAYLLWKSDENAPACAGDARLWSQRLGVDGISLLDHPKELLARDRGWELPLIEGPSMLKADGRYYLFYSANWWSSSSYGIGYAECASPAGPCTKKTMDGPLVRSKGDTLGPGGQEFFKDVSGRTWMAYHAWSSPTVGYEHGGARSLRIDPVQFVDGAPSVAGPSTSPRFL